MGSTADLSNSEEVEQEETADEPLETQQEETSTEEQPTGQDSPFATIDRDSLSPELQTAFDSMNRAFTQGMQTNAADRRQLEQQRDYAAIGELVETNPAINQIVWNSIQNQRNGTPVGVPAESPQPLLEGMNEEEAAGFKMIGDIVEEKLRAVLPGYMGSVDQVAGYVRANQRRTEYDVLCQEFEAARTVTPKQLQTMQLRYKTADGNPISAREAYLLYAGSNPALLEKKSDLPPSGGTPKIKSKLPSVEKGTGSTGTRSFAPGSGGFTALKEAAGKLLKDGVGGVGSAMDRARVKFQQDHRQS